MKATTLVSLAALVPTLALADARPLAVFELTGGFRPQPALTERVVVQRDGLVSQYRGERRVAVLARISNAKTQELTTLVEGLGISPLQLVDPEGPVCIDAPRLGYSIHKRQGSRHEIAVQEDCRAFRMREADWRAERVVEILDGMWALASMR